MLLLQLEQQHRIIIGRRGSQLFSPGVYCYVGSALGPGGLRARLKHHATTSLKKHWHIDYFLAYTSLNGALIKESTRRLECNWASWVEKLARSGIYGFGASDCRCQGHLFFIDDFHTEKEFIRQAITDLQTLHISKRKLKHLK